MALPIAPGIAGAGPDGATLLLGIRGSWRGRPTYSAGPADGLNRLRTSLDKKLGDAMRLVGGPGGNDRNVQTSIEADLRAVFKDFMPPDIQIALRSAIAEAAAENSGPPRLRIYVHPDLEWIPWELFHDGTDYLGVRFLMTRLPIVDSGPEARPPGSPRVVTSIASVLGETITPANGKLFKAWRGTFDGLVNGIHPNLWPAAADVWPVIEDVMEAAKADIVHITCHGGYDDEGTGYWTLNDKTGTRQEHQVAVRYVEMMELATEGPLVFANACSSTAPAKPVAQPGGIGVPSGGLASAFFRRGALAFVGPLAPITQPIAIPFARRFFAKLLTPPAMSVATALWATKAEYRAEKGADPSYLFYCLYGPPDTRFTC
jgi:hypothetical protein